MHNMKIVQQKIIVKTLKKIFIYSTIIFLTSYLLLLAYAFYQLKHCYFCISPHVAGNYFPCYERILDQTEIIFSAFTGVSTNVNDFGSRIWTLCLILNAPVRCCLVPIYSYLIGQKFKKSSSKLFAAASICESLGIYCVTLMYRKLPADAMTYLNNYYLEIETTQNRYHGFKVVHTSDFLFHNIFFGIYVFGTYTTLSNLKNIDRNLKYWHKFFIIAVPLMIILFAVRQFYFCVNGLIVVWTVLQWMVILMTILLWFYIPIVSRELGVESVCSQFQIRFLEK